MTQGKVCDSDVQTWLQADFSVNSFVGWMGQQGRDELLLNSHLRTDAYFAPGNKVGDALRSGSRVVDPDCDLYADKAALVPVSDDIETFFASHLGQHTTSSYAFVERYRSSQPCTVIEITSDGVVRNLESVPIEGSIIIESGKFVHEPVLGSIFYADAVGSCTLGKLTRACRLVS